MSLGWKEGLEPHKSKKLCRLTHTPDPFHSFPRTLSLTHIYAYSNKTRAIRTSAVNLVAGINAPRVQTINASFTDVQLHLAALVACLAPGNVAPAATCRLPGMNARQRLEILVSEMQDRFDLAAADLQYYIVSSGTTDD